MCLGVRQGNSGKDNFFNSIWRQVTGYKRSHRMGENYYPAAVFCANPRYDSSQVICHFVQVNIFLPTLTLTVARKIKTNDSRLWGKSLGDINKQFTILIFTCAKAMDQNNAQMCI